MKMASQGAIDMLLRCIFAIGLFLAPLSQPGFARETLAYAPPQRALDAPEARQGVASDGSHIYAIDNSTIGKYDIASGRQLGIFKGDPAQFPHLNSCTVARDELVCASSNYPALPYRNTAEFFDPRDMRHLRSTALPADLGSLTVLDWHDGQWWAVFANYDGKGGIAGKDHRDTVFARLNPDFSVAAKWSLPGDVLQRLVPSSISGASWGDDGLLYASGHDKPEIYVLALPKSGVVLRHVGTIAVASFGQAVDFDPVAQRLLWSIDRNKLRIFATPMPIITERER
jgi:hypothetical protein